MELLYTYAYYLFSPTCPANIGKGSFGGFYSLNYAGSVFYSDQLKSET